MRRLGIGVLHRWTCSQAHQPVPHNVGGTCSEAAKELTNSPALVKFVPIVHKGSRISNMLYLNTSSGVEGECIKV
jgi:hypothetical protein